MRKEGIHIKVELTVKQKLDYYWWVIYWWTPALMAVLGGLYIKLFLESKGEIKYIFYAGLGAFIVGLIGLFILKRNLNFKTIDNDLPKPDNYELIIQAIRELKWKQNKIRKGRIVVSQRGYDILPGQIITIIPDNNRIYFNCIHTTHKFTNPSVKIEKYQIFKEKIIELINNKYNTIEK